METFEGNNGLNERFVVEGLNPFESWDRVVFKVREAEGHSGSHSASTADNNKGGYGANPAQEDM